jgi:hypothetical protein
MKRVGWYVNDNFFLNKWEAIQNHGTKNISFYFYEDVFDKYDWSKPIQGSLNELYWLRAQQLRDSYDYIRLWYTGGSDSQTMLNAFVNNNIFIDEIITVRVGVINSFNRLESETEITKRAIPNLELLDIPNTKITLVPVGPDKMLDNLNNQDYFKDVGAVFLRSPVYASSIYSLFPNLMLPAHDKHETLANVQGHLKPRLEYKNNQFYCSYWDTEFTGFNLSPNVECFYSSPLFPELHIKQQQVLQNYLKTKYKKIMNNSVFSENTEFKHDIEIATRDWVDRSADLLKGQTGIISNKSKLAVKEAYLYNRRIYDAYQEKLYYFKKIEPRFLQHRESLKTKEYCLGP